MSKEKVKDFLKKTWHFIWHEDSAASWIVNVILAFLLIYFIVYPVLGFVFQTSHPVVAVVSESMEHDDKFDVWWSEQEQWYTSKNITKEEFQDFPFKNGFNKGDIMVLYGKKLDRIETGDILVFRSSRPNPIIHRVVNKWQQNGQYFFQTKGDHNKDSIEGGFVNERQIGQERIVGTAVFRIPYLGWIKIIFVELIGNPYCKITNNLFPCRGG